MVLIQCWVRCLNMNKHCTDNGTYGCCVLCIVHVCALCMCIQTYTQKYQFGGDACDTLNAVAVTCTSTHCTSTQSLHIQFSHVYMFPPPMYAPPPHHTSPHTSHTPQTHTPLHTHHTQAGAVVSMDSGAARHSTIGWYSRNAYCMHTWQ